MKGKSIIAIEKDNYKNEIDRKGYKGIYAASKYLNINPGLIRYCCEEKKYVNLVSLKMMEGDTGLFMNILFVYRFIQNLYIFKIYIYFFLNI